MLNEFQPNRQNYTQEVLAGPPARLFYSKEQACEAAGGISRATLERAINNKHLICHHVGRRPVIYVDELKRWIFENGGRTK